MTGYSGDELTQMGFEIFGLLPRELRVWILSGGYQFDAKSVREKHSLLRRMERFDWDIYKRDTKDNKKGDIKQTTKNIKNAFQMTTAKWRKEREIKHLTKCGVTFHGPVTQQELDEWRRNHARWVGFGEVILPPSPIIGNRHPNRNHQWASAMFCVITPHVGRVWSMDGASQYQMLRREGIGIQQPVNPCTCGMQGGWCACPTGQGRHPRPDKYPTAMKLLMREVSKY